VNSFKPIVPHIRQSKSPSSDKSKDDASKLTLPLSLPRNAGYTEKSHEHGEYIKF
jgi:hypothetical protein